MMKKFIFTLAALLLISPTLALAESSFVIEAESAQPDIGIQVQGDTQISIGDGGHILVVGQH